MSEGPLKPAEVLAESHTDDPLEFVRLGVAAAKSEDYERGLIFLTEAYNRLAERIELKGDKVAGEASAASRNVVPAIALSALRSTRGDTRRRRDSASSPSPMSVSWVSIT